MTLKIYNNKTNKIIFKTNINQEILNNYEINTNEENFDELFETEILNDVFEENNIKSNEVYYELIK
jgi:hypothetical protein|tara:strand:+ start:321 stop:518 length:198 start_codon:yes stop_codon:yes gene_type:complete